MYQQLNLKTKIKKQAEQKDLWSFTDTENVLTVARRRGVGGMDEKGGEIKYKLVVPGIVTGMLRTAQGTE